MSDQSKTEDVGLGEIEKRAGDMRDQLIKTADEHFEQYGTNMAKMAYAVQERLVLLPRVIPTWDQLGFSQRQMWLQVAREINRTAFLAGAVHGMTEAYIVNFGGTGDDTPQPVEEGDDHA